MTLLTHPASTDAPMRAAAPGAHVSPTARVRGRRGGGALRAGSTRPAGGTARRPAASLDATAREPGGAAMALSYAHGASSVPLVGETVGENLERTAARFPDRDALVSCHQDLRYTYAELDADVNRLARGLLASGLGKGERIGIWSPNCAEWVLIQYATAKIGAILVNINPAYQTHEAEYALRQSGCRMLVAATDFRTSNYVEMIDVVRPNLPELEIVMFLGTSDWADLLGAADRVGDDELRARASELAFDDPINIQYTSGTTGFPKGATLSHHNILNNGYFIGEGCAYTEADRVCIPVPFYHCFGMVLGNLACTTHGAAMVIPGGGVRPGRHPASRGRRALHQPLRRADHVHRRARPARLRRLRPVQPAHGDHGRLALPGRGHEAVHQRDAHGRGHDLLRHDRDLAGVDPDRSPTTRSTSGSATVGRVHPHVEIKIVDPDTGAGRPARRSPASCARAATA